MGLAAVAGASARFAAAELAWLAEHGRGTFDTFGDALLWAAGTVIATQGDPVPETVLARLTMLGGFVVGLVLVATLAGTVGAYLVEEHRERSEADQRGTPDTPRRSSSRPRPVAPPPAG